MDTAKLREQIENFFDQGLSIEKMAGLLDVSEETLKKNLPREKLRGKINDLVEEGYS